MAVVSVAADAGDENQLLFAGENIQLTGIILADDLVLDDLVVDGLPVVFDRHLFTDGNIADIVKKYPADVTGMTADHNIGIFIIQRQ